MWCTHPHQENSSDTVNGVTSVLLTIDLSCFGRTNEEYRDGILSQWSRLSCAYSYCVSAVRVKIKNFPGMLRVFAGNIDKSSTIRIKSILFIISPDVC